MRKRWHLSAFVIILVVVILIVSHIYHVIEGWRYLDSIYFVVITMTTIGYGDLAPVTDVGKILTIFASFFGIAMVFYLISVIGSHLFERKLKRLGIDLGVKMDSKIKLPFYHRKKKK